MPRIALIACALAGIVVEGSIKPGSGRVDFTLEEQGKTLPITYVGSDPLPDTFKDKSQALVEDVRVLTAALSPNMCRPSALPSTKPLPVATSQPRPALPNEAACNAPVENPRGEAVSTMDVFGSFTLLLAFVCAVYALVGGIAAIITRHPLLVKSTRQAGMATCVLIFIATFSLEYLLFTDNFSQGYVVSHSNRDLSAFYKVAALWSGQEGSLLFWSFLLSVYVISVLIAYRNKNGGTHAIRGRGPRRCPDFLSHTE